MLGRQLPAAGLDIDAAANANGGGNAVLLKDGTESFGAFLGGGAARKLPGRVERDHVDMADQAL